jgi:hypothetical protein
MLDGVLLKVDEVLFIGVLRRFITGRGDKLLHMPGGVLLGSCACHLFFNVGRRDGQGRQRFSSWSRGVKGLSHRGNAGELLYRRH